MFKDIRKNTLYSLIENNPYQYSSELIGNKLSISSRTVRKEIKEINELIVDHGFSIMNQRGKGYYINITNQEDYDLFNQNKDESVIYFDVNHKNERIKQFISLLLNQNHFDTIEALAERMYVSRTTLTSDLDDVRKLLESYNLRLESKVGKGVFIEGSEKDKRNTLLSLIDESLDEHRMGRFFEWKGESFYLDELKSELPHLFNMYHMYFTDDNLNNIIYHIMIMMERIQNDFVLDEIGLGLKFKEHELLMNDVTKLLSDLFKIKIPTSELDYLYIQIKSKVIPSVDQEYIPTSNVQEYIHSLLEKINQNYYYDLMEDEQLRNDLTSHIYSMLYRVENQIRVRNPMEEHIKKYYPLAFEMTLYAVESIKKEYNYEVNQGEIAYLALHIGASLEKNYQIKYERHNSCLIVCGSGWGTARMIEASIKQTIPDVFITKTISAQKYNQLQHIEEDIVITTIDIEEKNKPVFKIETLPSKKQLIRLDQKIRNEVSQSVDIFSKYFSGNLFFKKEFHDKNEVIKTLVKSFIEEDVIDKEDDFIASILEREKLGSTVLGEGISIPHPMNLLAKETKIGVAILDNPIKWGNDQSIQLVFMLAISKKDYEEALGIYDFLVEIIRENQFKTLITAENYHDFISKARALFEEM